jgi:exo-1,4-beta-D-glucosaminidase
MYAYDDAHAYAVNSMYSHVPGPLWATAELFTGDGVIFARASGGLPDGLLPDGVADVLELPTQAAVAALLGPRRAYFIALRLFNGSDASAPVVSRSTYWLSTQPDVLDWANSTYIYTPCSTFADYTDLLELSPAPLLLSTSSINANTTIVNVTNTASDAVAFLVHLRLLGSNSSCPSARQRHCDSASVDIWPVVWTDNYFTLQPGETRSVAATYDGSSWSAVPTVAAETYNTAVAMLR